MIQVTAMDDDAGDEVSYAITGGADQALFQINATNGLLATPSRCPTTRTPPTPIRTTSIW